MITQELDKYPPHNLDRKVNVQDYSSTLMLQGKANYQNKRGNRMKEHKERLIRRLGNMQDLIPDTIEAVKALPELEFLGLYTILDPGTLRLQMDYDIKRYKLLRRALGSDWQYQYKRFNDYTGAFYIKFNHKFSDVLLTIQLDLSTDGQACKLVKVGEQKPDPIYKVVCE